MLWMSFDWDGQKWVWYIVWGAWHFRFEIQGRVWLRSVDLINIA